MAESNVQLVRTFNVGPHSVCVVVPKHFGIEKGVQLLATKDAEGRITYERLDLALKEKVKS